MIVGKLAKPSRILLALFIVLAISGLVLGMKATPASESLAPDASGVESDSDPSVTCVPFGLYGNITTLPLVGRLSDSSDNLTFVGTTNGLYVVAPGGKLQHFLYSPFGIKHMALINDITGDGIREVVVALDDTQVPALRCFDGSTWDKVWQFAPIAKIWDKLWVERQLIITNLEVIDDGDSQRVVLTSGRCVLSVDPKDGTEQWRFTASAAVWRMVTLADLNGDDADEVLVGSDDGHLFWLNCGTGKVQWQTRLPEHKGANYNGYPTYDDVNHQVSDIVVLDEEAGKVAVASGDGSVQMYDLLEKRRDWDTLVFENDPNNYSPSDYVLLSPTADITGDGLPEVLLTKTPSGNSYALGWTSGEVALCDSAGSIVWHKGTPDGGTEVPLGTAFETSLFEGKPVYLDGRDGISLVDVRDGKSVLHTIPLDALNGWGAIMKQPGGDGYLSLSSSSDLAAISANGDLVWYYPRIGNIKAVKGSFVGDSTEDVLLQGESGIQPNSVRLLRMMDGTTGSTAWSYEAPYSELKGSGGLKGVRVTANLAGSDNVPDIIGYCGDSILIFSGKDGTHSEILVAQPIASLDVIHNGASGNAFAVGVAGGLMIFDTSGIPLWTTASTDWIGDESGSFMALDDFNADNVSDLAVSSSSRIVVLKSNGHASDYQLHHAIQSETGFSIRLPEVVADSDGDGVRELAYLQEAALQRQGDERGPMHSPPRHLLCIQSLEDRQSLLKADLQGTILGYDLACGDFNADGYPDSAMLLLQWSETGEGKYGLRILSDKDGSLLWEHAGDVRGYGYSSSSDGIAFIGLPAMNVGDINDDGADDLACNVSWDPNQSWNSPRQQRLQIIDVAHDATLKDVTVVPSLHSSSFNYYRGVSYEPMLQLGFGIDGPGKLIMTVEEPSTTPESRNAYTSYGDSTSPHYVALLDLDNGQRLATFTGFQTEAMSLFESHQPGVIGLAACGGLCYLHLDSDLQITSPEDGENTEPIVEVRWEGPADGDFSQVFVDGVRNDITNGLESELFLARGNHTIVVRSVDDCGRISYSPSDLSAPLAIKVAPSPWKPVWLVASLFALLAITLVLFYARLHRAWRARKRAAK